MSGATASGATGGRPDGGPLLRVDDLRVEFVTRDARTRPLDGVSLEVGRGEVVGLVGETGCGKTLTGLSVLGLLPPTARVVGGSIAFDGRDLLALGERELRSIRGSAISMIFQNPATAFNPVFTVGSQMRMVLSAHLALRGRAADERIRETLTAVGLPEVDRVGRSYPHQLSGGMLQRAMIGLSLLCRPALLIADEPTTALDVTIAAQILLLLRTIQSRQGFSVLFITHDLGVVRAISDRVVVLYAGRVAESASTAELFRSPQHPYTQGLMSAVPRASARRASLASIPGVVPADPGSIVGCAFADRCPDVIERCRIERPALLGLDPARRVACHVAVDRARARGIEPAGGPTPSGDPR